MPTRKPTEPGYVTDLRRRAQARLKPAGHEELARMSTIQVAHLLYELETHQIELEMQNEELRKAQEELIAARDRYTELYDFAPVGYLTLSNKGLIEEANLALAEMLGQPLTSLIHQRLSAFILDRDQDVFYRLTNAMKKVLAKRECEVRLRTARNSLFWALLRCAPEKNPHADERGPAWTGRFWFIVTDITRRKQAEMELQQQSRHLEELFRERTTENTILADETHSTIRDIADFSKAVLRDPDGPLRRIDALGHALTHRHGRLVGEKGKHCLRDMRSGTRKLAEMVEGLLNLSQIAEARLTRRRTDLSAIVRGILDEFRRAEPARDAVFQIENSIVVRGDPPLLTTMLRSLLENAWKFSRPKEKTQIQFRRTTNCECDPVNERLDPQAEACFVRDRGVGFDTARADTLFRAFHRAADADTFEGLGLGLATVERVVHRHGGHVWARGEPGVGATFYFHIPEEHPSKRQSGNP